MIIVVVRMVVLGLILIVLIVSSLKVVILIVRDLSVFVTSVFIVLVVGVLVVTANGLEFIAVIPMLFIGLFVEAPIEVLPMEGPQSKRTAMLSIFSLYT